MGVMLFGQLQLGNLRCNGCLKSEVVWLLPTPLFG